MEEQLRELQQIRTIMERSGRFLSLSGASGVMAGCYAIAGALIFALLNDFSLLDTSGAYSDALLKEGGLGQALLIAAVVLILSIGTGMLMSRRKANRNATSWWSKPARMLVINLALPLITGGAVSMILGYQLYFALVPGLILVFYGLALFAGSRYTFSDIKYLGFAEILLGLLALCVNSIGFLSWVIGFGLFHILYGIIMYLRLERSAA